MACTKFPNANFKHPDMNTRKYPRTLNEAFGPYASGPIYSQRKRRALHINPGLIAYAAIITALSLIAIWK